MKIQLVHAFADEAYCFQVEGDVIEFIEAWKISQVQELKAPCRHNKV
jgi:hypothetical protein